MEASKASWVTSILPKIGLEYRPATAFNLSAAYAPDVSVYHSASSENYATHRGTLNLNGRVEDTTWELLNTASYIDGSTKGPTFARPDDIPGLGAIPLSSASPFTLAIGNLPPIVTIGSIRLAVP